MSFTGQTGLPGADVSSRNCLFRTFVDWTYYGSEPLNRRLFVLDPAAREILGVEIPFLRSGVLGLVELF
jgi:hypothetical protein